VVRVRAGLGAGGFFPVTEQPDEFQTVAEFTGNEDASEEELEEDPAASELMGDLDGAVDQMEAQFLPSTRTTSP
jgi:hypothetical protein